MENNCRKFGDTTRKQKQYDSDEESASSGEEKGEEEALPLEVEVRWNILVTPSI